MLGVCFTTVLIIFACFGLSNGECPFGTVRLEFSNLDGDIVANCYVYFKFQEIKQIWDELWLMEHTPEAQAGVVESFVMAERMCLMIPWMRKTEYTKNFKNEYRDIPDLGIQLRVPIPRSQDHLRVLNNLLYNPVSGGYEGRMWLAPRETPFPAYSTPKAPVYELTSKPGPCMFLYVSTNSDKSGFYHVTCDDVRIWDPTSLKPGKFHLACEFDEPQDCQVGLNETCVVTVDHDCVIVETRYIKKKGHPRLGKPCHLGSPKITTTPCPAQLIPKYCKRDCEWGNWRDDTGCLIEWEVCNEEDGFGKKEQSRIYEPAMYEGKHCVGEEKQWKECACEDGGWMVEHSPMLTVIGFVWNMVNQAGVI